MSDDKIKSVLRRAAEDRAFRDALMADRKGALDTLDLTPAEKAVLMAPTRAQLRKMIDEARKRPWGSLARSGLFLGGVAAAAGFTGLVALPLFATTGHTAESPHASTMLRHIAAAQGVYREEWGRYGSLEELVEAGMITVPEDAAYRFGVTVEGDTFIATASHRKRPDSRRGYQMGPDGVVKPLE